MYAELQDECSEKRQYERDHKTAAERLYTPLYSGMLKTTNLGLLLRIDSILVGRLLVTA